MSEIASYRDLKVWQSAMNIAEGAYTFTRRFPQAETYGMTSQIRRSAASVAANIAEGYGRDSTGAYANFLCVAQGSLKEQETHILIAARVGLSDDGEGAVLLSQCDELGRMLRSLIRSIERHGGEKSVNPTAYCLLPTASESAHG